MLVGIAFEVHIYTGFECYSSGIFITLCATVCGGYAFDALQVGEYEASEAPLIAKQVGKQISVACAGHTVD